MIFLLLYTFYYNTQTRRMGILSFYSIKMKINTFFLFRPDPPTPACRFSLIKVKILMLKTVDITTSQHQENIFIE